MVLPGVGPVKLGWGLVHPSSTSVQVRFGSAGDGLASSGSELFSSTSEPYSDSLEVSSAMESSSDWASSGWFEDEPPEELMAKDRRALSVILC